MKPTNQVMLITYPDSLGKNLKDLRQVLETKFKGAIGGVHILPFFPSSADRGFAPTNYRKVDPSFGNWDDIHELAQNYYLMFDFMVNHLSKKSIYFKDFVKNHNQSQYRDMFIRWNQFWPKDRLTQADIDQIYKRKPQAPIQEVAFDDGEV